MPVLVNLRLECQRRGHLLTEHLSRGPLAYCSPQLLREGALASNPCKMVTLRSFLTLDSAICSDLYIDSS